MTSDKNNFTFIDLFAGIGGLRLAFEASGGKCIFTSEWNKFSNKTYKENFKDNHQIVGDITQVHESSIPNFDVLLAGFPCQPFSIAGVSKKKSLGRAHGFEDKTQGTLFFDVARIIAKKQPAAFLLENVKNLLSHDKGNTFKVIKETLENELGYHIFYKVINGSHFVPQNRERIVIVGFKDKVPFSFDEMHLPEKTHTMKDILHHEKEDVEDPYTILDNNKKLIVNPKYTLSDKLWNYLQDYAKKHKEAGNGFGYGLVYPTSTARTLSARYHKDGSEILVYQDGSNPRRLTPRECARLMGFEDSFIIPVSDTQAYKQFGNSVIMPVFKEVARVMTPHILNIKNS